jgi:uncharacterized protein
MRLPYFRGRRVATLPLLLVFACIVSATVSAYQQSVEKWRSDYEAELKSDNGWLTVSGLFWLHEGQNRFGSDPLCDIVLPASAPSIAGYFEFRTGTTVVHMSPGVRASINGKSVVTAELHPDSKDDRLLLDGLLLYVHSSGDRYAIRLRDKNSKLRKNFSGLHWFPIDETYLFTAQYVPYDSPKTVESQNVLGDAIKVSIVGYATFSFHGEELRLETQAHPDGTLFIVFRDLTSGKETYPASRFLDTDLPKDGRNSKTVQLDFNKAYNPPCAYNPYTTCPLPLPGNRLRVEIRAGEKLYKHSEGS